MAHQSAGRIPSLDGLRAISIAAVLLGHLTGTVGFPGWIAPLVEGRYVDLAHLGVRVFFVISGFLITGLLIHELEKTGTVSLSRFYVRRTLRIFPAYFALLGVLVLLHAWGFIAVPRSDFIHAVTYTVNYDAHRVWQIGHLWSLAVEEQFYLLWPAAVVLAGTRRSARRIAIGVMCIAPLVRVTLATLGHLSLIDTSFETACDAIATGCLLALYRDELELHAWYGRAVESRWIGPAVILTGLLISTRYRSGLLLGETVVNVGVALVLDRCVRRPAGAAGRVLNSKLLVYVGRLSYSLYLWQQLFLNRAASTLINRFPVNLALTAVCAVVSYYAVEKPFLLEVRPRVERWLVARRLRWLGATGDSEG